MTEPPPIGAILTSVVAGGLVTAAGLGVRFGSYRRWESSLGQPGTRAWLRNSPFIWIPAGGAMLLLGLTASMPSLGVGSPLAVPALGGGALLLFMASCLWVQRPPDLFVPSSLREYARSTKLGLGERVLLGGLAMVMGLGAALLLGAVILSLVIGTR